MAILSCHVSIKLPPKISDGQAVFMSDSFTSTHARVVQAVALVEARRNNSGDRQLHRTEAPDAIGILPDVSGMLLSPRNDDSVMAPRSLAWRELFVPIHLPGLRSSVHCRIPFPGTEAG